MDAAGTTRRQGGSADCERPAFVHDAAAKLAEYQQRAEVAGEGDRGFVAELVALQVDVLRRRTAVWEAFRAQGGEGTILRHASRETWCLFLRDATEGKGYRLQYFDADGFHSHSTHETVDTALMRMADDGYVASDPGRLEQLARTSRWADGMEIVHVIAQLGRGRIDWEEADRRVAAIRANRVRATTSLATDGAGDSDVTTSAVVVAVGPRMG